MTITVTTEARANLQADLLLVPLTTDPSRPLVEGLASTLGAPLTRAADDFSGEKGDTLVVYPDADDAQIRRVALVGLGTPEALDEEALRCGAAGGASVAQDLDAAVVACLLPEMTLADAPGAQSLVEGMGLGAYRYPRYKTAPAPDALETFILHAGDAHDADDVRTGAETGRILADAACTARDLVNRPPNEKTARDLADAIQTSGHVHDYDVDVWDEPRIRDEGMGGLLAVNQGSVEPPTFSVLTWAPDDAVNEAPIALVGKGVVFDTGGLSLKDTKGSMDLMKSDMAGAAAVIGAFEALADLEVPLHVVGLVPATDNRPGQNAYVPSDVIRMHSGATVEVMNTDAEGRLLLADALSYAQSLAPELVIDAATLTGSSIVALGTHAAAVMTSESDDAAERLYAIQRAGERSGERVHPLPMYDAYKQQLDSNVADLTNVGGRKAGAITAGKFLEHFTDFPWMHLDMAGPAFLQTAKPYRPTGGTGFGVRLLATYLRDYVTTRHQA